MSNPEETIDAEPGMQTLEMELSESKDVVSQHDVTQEPQITVLEGIGEISKGVSNKKAMFLVFRSCVGIGILTMPHQINEIGIIGALIFFPTIAIMILYSLDLMIKTANDLEYYDQR